MEFLGSLIAGGASGGILGIGLGLVSSVIKIWGEGRRAEADRRFRAEEHARALELHRMELEAGRAETENELAIAREAARETGMRASYEDQVAAGKTVRWQWVGAVRTLFRPFLTTALLAIVVWMFGDLLAVLGGEEGTLEVLGVDTALELVEYIVVSVVFLSSTPACGGSASAPSCPVSSNRDGAMTGLAIDVWIMRAAVGAVIAACVGLFVRLRKVETGRGRGRRADRCTGGPRWRRRRDRGSARSTRCGAARGPRASPLHRRALRAPRRLGADDEPRDRPARGPHTDAGAARRAHPRPRRATKGNRRWPIITP